MIVSRPKKQIPFSIFTVFLLLSTRLHKNSYYGSKLALYCLIIEIFEQRFGSKEAIQYEISRSYVYIIPARSLPKSIDCSIYGVFIWSVRILYRQQLAQSDTCSVRRI
jgi:hypothetical protein